ncbi:GntR family transcriptional regulator [Bifidobacterium tibiigranuli]|uniref:GntR family transcriptional regulator n=1 Tax=Bifidobacterium tibiigranuli TaxID=2172043 RepID=UPI0023523F5D|nr:GntR family transcriptional regulator [Bifidobacterium tibiigranuli]MCI1211705.1 GntR family transcriptional regulator [Bifidobacterium tibiigranuli]MCI1221604.1 GntR family transcriptional regulator [Bifidobacterium tibiigranuli]MCI1649284.1 GntR family transcriptional regulator [Bifidobacterium tibiigranuli]MCI1791922.1 GntR family transcriptional regulator [Bifidobacterium tibiigranuli]MCI2184615.1 GntR family transcriptional regulator [Bifidobacterium tibiigranuli]
MAQNYRKLAERLRARISSGEFAKAGKLPTEDQLIEEYQTTRYSVRNAIALLAEAGDVFPVRGSGVFVRENRGADYLSVGITRGISSEYPNRSVTSIVYELALIRADAELARRMHCEEGSQAWKVVRLRQVDGHPLAYETAWYLKEFVPFINEQIAEGSLFAYARNDLGLNFGYVDKVLYAGKLDAVSAKILGLQEGDPALYLDDDSFLTNGRLFNSSHIAYHYENTRFFTMTSMK